MGSTGTFGDTQHPPNQYQAVSFVDGNGNALGRPSSSTSTAYEASRVVKATPGTLLGFSGYNSNASTQFIQVHDATALPANGVAPKILLSAAGSSPFSFDLGTYGRAFANGIVICNSSTGPTKAIGAADCWFDVQYV
jgi:hypothetical protein